MNRLTLAVALSGGPDSWALALAARPAFAFIVDHGLRPESAQEAATVQARARELGMSAHILRWESPKPTAGLMEAARHARYALLLEACYRHGCTHLLLGHHQDDQIETVLMRRAHNSGWRGLAGMPWQAERAGVTVVRPFLGTPKSDLVEICRAAGIPTVDDPSNRNPAFTRARLRLALPELMSPPERARLLDDMAAHARRRQDEQDRLTTRLRDTCQILPGGSVVLPADATVAVGTGAGTGPDDDEGFAFLTSLLRWVGQQTRPPRAHAVTALTTALPTTAGATLAGCHLSKRGDRIMLVREAAAIRPLEIPPGRHDLLWDRRLRLQVEVQAPHTLIPVGTGAWRHLQEAGALACLPGFARKALPVLSAEGSRIVLLQGRLTPFFDPFRQVFTPGDQFGFLSAGKTV